MFHLAVFCRCLARLYKVSTSKKRSRYSTSLNANYENVRRPKKIIISHSGFSLSYFFHFFILNGIINFKNFFKIIFSNLTLKIDKNMFLKKKKKKKKKNLFLLIIRAIIYFLCIFLYLKLIANISKWELVFPCLLIIHTLIFRLTRTLS